MMVKNLGGMEAKTRNALSRVNLAHRTVNSCTTLKLIRITNGQEHYLPNLMRHFLVQVHGLKANRELERATEPTQQVAVPKIQQPCLACLRRLRD